MNAKRRRRLLSGVYLTLGVVVISIALALADGFPSDTDFWLAWAAFAGASVVLAHRSVEVNDRMLMSSSGMVVFTAGAFFAVEGLIAGQVQSAVLPITAMAAAGFLTRGDLRGEHLWRALTNLGQLAGSGFAAGLVVDAFFGTALTTAVLGTDDVSAVGSLIGARGVALVVASMVAGASAYTLVNLVLVRVAVLILYRRESLLPWAHLGRLLGSLVIQAVIGGLLGLVLAVNGSISLVPLVLSMFIIGHMAFTSQATLRATHESMLRGFVKILETRDLYTRGHTERVAEFSMAIGRELGFSESQLARLRWAALIHDVGKLAVPTAIMRKQGALTDDEYREMRVSTHKVDDLLSEVDFLAPMVVICSGVHPKLTDEDFGQTGHVHSREATSEQSVLAVADAFDAMTSTRSYRMAMSQSVALQRLGGSSDPLFHAEVVEALGRALSRMSGSYGPPEISHHLGAPPGEVLHA
jgi:HD-GYP domain-containing protein (c-di-GMP phosphodiesterase class II)